MQNLHGEIIRRNIIANDEIVKLILKYLFKKVDITKNLGK